MSVNDDIIYFIQIEVVMTIQSLMMNKTIIFKQLGI
jgi:hypothetical protein